MTFICATSLYVASQNASSGGQTASWQQALSGAETAVDHTIATLNLNNAQGWSGWKTVSSGQLPATQPSGGSNANSPPNSNQYNYLLSTTPLASPVSGASPEGSAGTTWWATVDTAGLLAQSDANGNQWYRIRGTGVAGVPGPPRVSNNKLDNDLRKISLLFDRKTGAPISAPRASRTIEVVVQPVGTSTWARGITTRNWMSMAGDGNSLIGVVDSFDSSTPLKSTLGLYDLTKRQSHGDLAMTNSTSANLRSTFVYGNLTYSGPPVQNTNKVQGTIATPFNMIIPDTADPTWTPDSTYAGGAIAPFLIVTSGTKNKPAHIKINGDFTVAAGQTVTITNQDFSMTNNYIEFWVTGKFTTATGGVIVQSPYVHATWYVDNDITVSGASYLVLRAENLSFVGVGNNHTATESGIPPFVGTINAPGFDVTISGVGGYSGAVIGNTLTLNNLGSIHYDEALKGITGNAVANYAFASWFEDNSDKARGVSY